MNLIKRTYILIFLSLFAGLSLRASKLVEVKVVDHEYIMLYFMDGEVEFVDDGLGEHAFRGHHSEPENSYTVKYGDALALGNISEVSNWIITSGNDSNYLSVGLHPDEVHRKSRVNGMSYEGWDNSANDHKFDYTHEHFIYLKLPYPLSQNKTYTVNINESLNSDVSTKTITYDIFHSASEAIHVNLVGYMSSARVKSADLYHFLGDGGNRDYSGFEDNNVYLYNVDTEQAQAVGKVKFWMKSKKETNHNLTGSDVWNIDFSGFNQPGTYRLAVEGIGCSQDFEVRDDIYQSPYKLGVLGYFYMRIGEDSTGISPVPRRPLFIQDQDPQGCKIFITDMDPYHHSWHSFASGDKWDKPSEWAAYKKAGHPTNPNAIGGHSDALDWDRHLGHVLNVYDLCLAYILSDGALDDDNLGIAESGNGIPDIVDEARNEVDFWLNLRYKKGYSHGLTNPDGNNHLYQADNTPMAAWANALNSAMLAYCFLLAGNESLKSVYQDSAVVAFNYAKSRSNPMWNDHLQGVRGKDLYMMTAAYLYNLTGDTKYEDIMQQESVVVNNNSDIFQGGSFNQLWGVAAYLLTKQPVNYPGLQNQMKASVIAKAKSKESGNVYNRPSRRGYGSEQSWWQTSQDMHRTILAHAVTDNEKEKVTLLDALILEADWGLGRNPLNMIQMTTATTELESKRSIINCYTSGRNDGTPGLHPGHTPYLNIEGWGGNMVGSNPKKVLDKFYPHYNNWAHASRFINTRYIWSHSEFTPRQTMRGKALLYAYLYGLNQSGEPIVPGYIADAGRDFTVKDADLDGKEIVHLSATGSYALNNQISQYTWSIGDSIYAVEENPALELEIGSYQFKLSVADTSGNIAEDSVMVKVIAQYPGGQANYDFETTAQASDWMLESHGETDTITAGDRSQDRFRRGEYAYKMQANFGGNDEYRFVRYDTLSENVYTARYHVWVPQQFVDSAATGGIHNFLLQNNDQWISKFFDFDSLIGNGWNQLDLVLPDSVAASDITACGLSVNTAGISIGESAFYIDDIFFLEKDVPDQVTSIDLNDIPAGQLPEETTLFDNYPNPFQRLTKIEYYIPSETKVEINVFDMAGRHLQTLVNEIKTFGTHEVVFDAGRLKSGVYFYNLRTGHFHTMKKMMIL